MIFYHHYSIEEQEHLYGPGKRLVIWVQGCSIRCNGCINDHMWEFRKDVFMNIDEIISLCIHDEVDGVTLLGGEPLDQAEDLFLLVDKLKKKQLSIVLFTGYLKKQLMRKAQRRVWNMSDIVIAGPFVLAKRNIHLQFRGSSNQRVYSHPGKYHHYQVKDGISVSVIDIHENGTIDLKGFDSERIVPNSVLQK